MLPQNDAFALARAMKQLPYLETVPTSALVRSIVSKNDPHALLSLISLLDGEIAKQIHSVDPNATPEVLGNIIHARDLHKLPPIEWLRRGEIPKRGLTVLFGASGGGKSFLALDYALQIAQTETVLYIAAEGQSGYPQRVAAWCKHHRKSEGNLYLYLEGLSLANEAELETFMSEVGHLLPALIVVDTVAQTMTGFDENSARDMGLYLKACKRLLKAFDSAVMLIHHTNKGGVDERGSGALRGASDSMLRLNPEDDILVLEVSKSKDSRPFEPRYLRQVEIPLGTDSEGYPISSLVLVEAEKVENNGEKLTNNQIKILTILNEQLHEDGLGFGEIIELTSIPKPTLGRALASLYKYGFIEKDGRGKPYTITDSGRAKVS